jgi:DNA polymerase-4
MRSYRKRLPHVFAFSSCTLSFMSDPYEIGWLFADLNAFFASVEQELRPELRGQPIGIVPIEADTACCIAASYQAKAYGVKTGLRLDEALLLCPHLIVVQARPRLYVEYHHLIVAAIERCIPVQAVMSCDEFACQLMGRERHLRRAVEIAYSIKAELRTVGSTLRCSIGLAPNRLLAKVAGDMTKPDGLMIFERRHLPRALYGLKLGDIPGIGGRMEERVRAEGITTMRELCALPRERMHGIWGSVLGDRLWHWFRGVDFLEPAPKPLQSLSRQHILPPDCRTPERARGIAVKLLHSTARKMRRHGLWAGGISVRVGFYDAPVFEGSVRIPLCQDAHTLQSHVTVLWERVPLRTPSDIAVVLTHLDTAPLPDLFASESHGPDSRARATGALDAMNARYGLNTVYLGSIHDVRRQAPTRIPFGPPPPLEEFDDPADNVRKPPTRYTLSPEQLGRLAQKGKSPR